MPSKSPPKKKLTRADSEAHTFACQLKGNWFNIFIGFPESFYEGKYSCLPSFGSEAVEKGLRLGDYDEWEWRIITKRTAEKTAPVKFGGCNHVLQIWGILNEKGIKLERLTRFLPFPSKLVSIPPDVGLEFRQIHSVK